jgi:hypothetical protein
MDCREFRERHLAFLDDTLEEGEMLSMERHRSECERCSRHDVAIRRGLIVFRTLPAITPSPQFGMRLHTRLRYMREADARAELIKGPNLTTFLGAAAAVIAAGFVAATSLGLDETPRNLSLPPVVAMTPDIPLPPMVQRTFVAGAAAGMPVWPAAMLAEEAPLHFVNAELRLASWR